MTILNPENEEKLRQGFKYVNKAMLYIWRLGLGSWLNLSPKYGGRIMVLVHTGRRSGKIRRNNLNYSLIDGDVYCTAGFGTRTDWYRNIINNPNVEVWLPNGWWSGFAEDVTDIPERLAFLRQVLIDSGLAARSMGINPNIMPDDKLAETIKGYRLIRIRRITARTGPGGPSDLAWIWPATTFLLVLGILTRRRR